MYTLLYPGGICTPCYTQVLVGYTSHTQVLVGYTSHTQGGICAPCYTQSGICAPCYTQGVPKVCTSHTQGIPKVCTSHTRVVYTWRYTPQGGIYTGFHTFHRGFTGVSEGFKTVIHRYSRVIPVIPVLKPLINRP